MKHVNKNAKIASLIKHVFQAALYPATPDLAGQLQSSAPGFPFLLIIKELGK